MPYYVKMKNIDIKKDKQKNLLEPFYKTFSKHSNINSNTGTGNQRFKIARHLSGDSLPRNTE